MYQQLTSLKIVATKSQIKTQSIVAGVATLFYALLVVFPVA